MKRCLFALVAVLMFASPANAAQFSGPGAAYAQAIRLHVPGPSGPIYVVQEDCPEMPNSSGCAILQQASPGSPWTGLLRYKYAQDRDTVVHEMGHFFDVWNLNDRERGILKRALGLPDSMPWRDNRRFSNGDLYCNKTPCVHERFADAYAACALNYPPPRKRKFTYDDWITSYGWEPTRQQYLRVCRMIRFFAPIKGR